MFETEVKIYDTYIEVGRRNIAYADIVGIKRSADFLRRIAPHFPSVTLYLSSGRALNINNQQHKFVDTSYFQFVGADRFTDFNNLLDQKCTLSDQFSSWLSWRLLLPAALSQPIMFVTFLLAGYPFEKAHITTLLLSIVFLVPGFFWERHARKMAAVTIQRANNSQERTE